MTYDTTTEEGQDKRQIKFRAWDKENNKMVDPETYRLEFYGNGEVYLKDVVRTTSDIEIMQYTGLKDKNGNEIYEGDVIAVLHGDWPSCMGCHSSPTEHMKSLEKRYEVVFIQGEFAGKRNTGSYNPWSTDVDGNTYTQLTPDRHGYIEVIGNIYENPELLGNTK